MKVALIVLGCLLALVALLLSVRVGVLVVYGAEGLRVQVRAGWFRFTVVPAPKKQPKKSSKPKKQKKQKKQKKSAGPSEKKDAGGSLPKQGGSLSGLLSLLPAVLEALGGLCRRIRIEQLQVHYTIAGQPDPARAALQYGALSLGGDAVCLLLEQHLEVRDRDVSGAVDFTSESSAVALSAACFLRVGQALAVALRLFRRYWTWKKRRDSAVQEENTYG